LYILFAGIVRFSFLNGGRESDAEQEEMGG
jgi:hypothetical protein